MYWLIKFTNVTNLNVLLILQVVAGKLCSNMNRIRLPATVKMRVEFTKRRGERLNARDLLLVVGAVVVVTMVLLGLLHGLVFGALQPCLLNSMVFSPQFGGGFFVPSSSQHTWAQQIEMASSCPGKQFIQARALPAIIFIGTVPTSEQQQFQPGAVDRGMKTSREPVSSISLPVVNYDYTHYMHEFYGYKQGQKNILVKGRLKKNVSFWHNIGTCSFIFDVIENGYMYNIPMICFPLQHFAKNNRYALLDTEFVSGATQNLLDRALIEKCSNPPYIVNPLTVSVQSSGRKRLILDLRVVNEHVWKQSVKYDDIKVASAFLEKGFYMIDFYITSAYHFVEIFEPRTEFLGFSWADENGNTVYYKFLVLPFGLSSAF